MLVLSKEAVIRTLTGLAGCGLVTACGGPGPGTSQASHPPPSHPAASQSPAAAGPSLADRLCGGARAAAAKALGSSVSEDIVNPHAASLTCALTGHAGGRTVRVTVESQAGPRAYYAFDVETSHQDQVYGSGLHQMNQIPVQITVPGSSVAVWIPAQKLLVATDSTPANGGAGTYVTVAVTGEPGKIARTVAQAAARATFAAHPDGPS